MASAWSSCLVHDYSQPLILCKIKLGLAADSCALMSKCARTKLRRKALINWPDRSHQSEYSKRLFSTRFRRDDRVIFDTVLKHAQQQRALQHSDHANCQYLRRFVAQDMIERCKIITGDMENIVDIGSQGSIMHEFTVDNIRDRHTQHYTQLEFSPALKNYVQHVAKQKQQEFSSKGYDLNIASMECEPDNLPLQPQSADMILCNLAMHWINDIDIFMAQIMKALKPDGVFLGAMLGGSTLQELRSAFTVADMERLGGVSPHVSPMVQGNDVGDFLTKAGFALPTVDADTITVRYPDMFTLIEHLRAMGEGNASLSRADSVNRDVFLAAAAAYQQLYEEDDHTLPATYQIFYMIGFAPAESQPKPKRRGSVPRGFSNVSGASKEKDQQK